MFPRLATAAETRIGDDSARKRIAAVVLNPCITDARAIKAAETAAAAGYVVQVFCTTDRDGTSPATEFVNGVTYIRLPWQPRKLLAATLLPGPVAGSALLDWLSGALFHYLKYFFAERVFADAVRYFRPHVIHVHDLTPLPFASKVAAEMGAKVIYDAHELESGRTPPRPFFQQFLIRRFEMRYGRRADAVVTVGPSIADILKAEMGRDVQVVYNAPKITDTRPQRDIRTDCGLMAAQELLVYVGKVMPHRGIETALQALVEIPALHFACVGPCEESERRRITDLARKLTVEGRFHLLPAVHFSEVVPYIASADMGLLSLLPLGKSYEFAMPNKLFEMAFARVPIIAIDVPEIGRFIRRYANGYLYDPRDESKMPQIFRDAFARRSDFQIRDSAYGDMLEAFGREAQASKLLKLYEDLTTAVGEVSEPAEKTGIRQ